MNHESPTGQIPDKMNETTISRKERERQIRRSEIVVAAREVFSARGYSEATLDEIAMRAEFGKGTLYSYFQGKDDLYAAVIADCFTHCQRIADEAFSADESTFKASSERFAGGLFEYFFSNLGLVSLVMRELHMPRELGMVQERFAGLVSRLELGMSEAIGRGEVKPCHPRDVAIAFIATIFSLLHYATCGHTGCAEIAAEDPDLHEREDVPMTIHRLLALLDVSFFHGVLQMHPIPQKSILTTQTSTI
jgi:AcrR family transcriptional regulator